MENNADTQLSPAHRPLKVLVVDDCADDRAHYRRLLRAGSRRFEVLEADSVQNGIDIARTAPMDCIILDHDLPDGSGIGFLATLRSDPVLKDTAIVMVTGRGDEETAAEALRLGASDYMPKSKISGASIARCVLNAAEKSRLRHEAEATHEELEKSCKALGDFAHMASHDLKAPLRHITTYCGLLKDECGDQLNADGHKYVQRLMVNAERLRQLIDGLLAYSEARDSVKNKSYVDSTVITQEAMEVLEESVTESGAKITIGRLPVVKACPMLLKLVMQNLLSNAIKYRGAATPEISVKAEEKGNEFIFCVSDNGQGIAPEYHKQVFEPFQRLHSKDEVEGSGLGLSICKQVVQMHGGRIWVESAPGEGASFFFSLPKY
ncbi:MAG: ATP-binding protein [Alphaproteobacteria bacterium]